MVGVVSGSGRNGPLFRDVQGRIDELADVLKAGNGVEASAARVADEELGAIREDGYGMGEERYVHSHAEGGIVVAQRLLKFFEVGNRFPKQLRVKALPHFHEALLRGVRVQVQHDFDAQAVAPAKLPIEVAAVFHFRIQGIGVGDAEMMTIALKEGGDGQAGEMVGRDCLAGYCAAVGSVLPYDYDDHLTQIA